MAVCANLFVFYNLEIVSQYGDGVDKLRYFSLLVYIGAAFREEPFVRNGIVIVSAPIRTDDSGILQKSIYATKCLVVMCDAVEHHSVFYFTASQYTATLEVLCYQQRQDGGLYLVLIDCVYFTEQKV